MHADHSGGTVHRVACIELVRLDKEWLPKGEDAALYIRPFMFASDEYIGVRPSNDTAS